MGPRSAVFAPFDDLGLIVIDEEHDSSYKQEGDPRYDARVVAERRAAEEGAVLLAGSATPRPESVVRHERVRLASRVDGRPLPPVELLGMLGVAGALHERTRVALDDVRRGEEKAIVLLNRRGWSNFLSCRVLRPGVGVPRLRRDARPAPRRRRGRPATTAGTASRFRRCAATAGPRRSARHGAGTEQLERELEELMRPLPVFRLDADVTAAGAGGAVLRPLRRRARRCARGYQMVAKGHDFPAVTLGRGPRCRRHAALPGLPRRGAHLRARGPARRAAADAGSGAGG